MNLHLWPPYEIWIGTTGATPLHYLGAFRIGIFVFWVSGSSRRLFRFFFLLRFSFYFCFISANKQNVTDGYMYYNIFQFYRLQVGFDTSTTYRFSNLLYSMCAKFSVLFSCSSIMFYQKCYYVFSFCMDWVGHITIRERHKMD